MKNIFIFGINFILKSFYVIGLLFFFKNDNYAISLISFALIYSYLAPLLDVGLGIQLRNKFANNLETEDLIIQYKSFISVTFIISIFILTILFLINVKVGLMVSYVFFLAISLMIDTFYVATNISNKIIKVEISIYAILYILIFSFYKFIIGDILVLFFFIPLLLKVLYYLKHNFQLIPQFYNIFKLFSYKQFLSQILASFISIIPLAILQKNYTLFFVEIFLFARISNLLISLSAQFISFYPLLVIDKLTNKFNGILKYTFYLELILIFIISLIYTLYSLKNVYFILPFIFYYISTLFINIKSTILQYLNISFPLNIYIMWICFLILWFILETTNIKIPISLIFISTLVLFLFNKIIYTTIRRSNA